MKWGWIAGVVMGLGSLAEGATGHAWHVPDLTNHLGGIAMRNPFADIGTNTTVTVYNGNQFQGAGNPGNQTGGWLIYRAAGASWQSVGLSYDSESGNDKFWRGTFNTSAFGPAAVIEYYLKITYSDHSDTYLYGDDSAGLATDTESVAQARPYSIRNRAAWIFHAGNRTVDGSNVTFWAKTGYTRSNDLATAWATTGAVYYTVNGATPAGAFGAAGADTVAAPLAFDHPEGDSSPAGNALWFRGTASNLPAFTTVKYRIGLWHGTATNEEKFAEYRTGAAPATFEFSLGTLGEPALSVETTSNGRMNANYTTTKLFIDETAGETETLTVRFAPGEANVTAAEIFSNLNRRDFADDDTNGDGIEDGIQPPDGNLLVAGDTSTYYRAYTMTPAGVGEYVLTLPAAKTGAYRLTARWKVQGDSAWRWYTNPSANRRDHAVVVSPRDARSIVLYELNTLNVEADGPTFAQRSTFEDLWDGPGAVHTNRWNLSYLKGLGCNWLWFQPIHPHGVDGRETDPGTGSAYDPGSPYAIRNFFEVMPEMSRGNTRAAARTAFSNFVAAADAEGVGVMLDAPFNHTAWDCELAQAGVDLFAPAAAATDLIRDREARVYSRTGDYAQRAYDAGSYAVAPDRGDFGKWADVKDVFFGVYAALVPQNPQDNGRYVNEGDWFDYAHASWTNDMVTRNVWKYFARYALHWLDQTGYPANPTGAALAGQSGLDGLRCDFGQGLPPQAWEYIINVARTRKWNLVFMSESLDGGAVTYRSNRHFDILNENIVFPLKNAASAGDYRQVFESRRTAYGQGLVLLNNVSHDEENYVDPWQAVVRQAVVGTIDGAPLVFAGQELGLSRVFGYDQYETNFGKQIPHFKRYNSMNNLWNDSDFGNDQLYPVLAGIGSARQASAALRSVNRHFLNRKSDGAVAASVFAVAKYEEAKASPAFRDVVFAFANTDRYAGPAETFNVDVQRDGANLFGLKPGRLYNVKNLAAYEGADASRREAWVWGAPIAGSNLLANGFFAALNPVPLSADAWTNAPYEAQYLKLHDVTPPPAPAAPAAPKAYAIGGIATFAWPTNAFGPDDMIAGYRVRVGTTPGGADVADGWSATAAASVTGTVGQTLYVTVTPVSGAGIEGAASAASAGVPLLDPAGDADLDGMANDAEDLAGTDPLDEASVFEIENISPLGSEEQRVRVLTQPGRTYTILFNDLGLLDTNGWWRFGADAAGVWHETNAAPDVHVFVDDGSPNTTSNAPPSGRRYYRVKVE